MNHVKAKLMLAIYIKGKSLEPAEITALLGVEPSKVQRFGEQKLTSSMKRVSALTGLWAYSIESEAHTVAELVEKLAEQFRNCTGMLSTLPNVEEKYLDLFIAHDAEIDGGGEYAFELASNDMSLLAQFGLPVRFTVASVPP